MTNTRRLRGDLSLPSQLGHRTARAAALALFALIGGCSKSYLRADVDATEPDLGAQISSTSSYRARLEGIKTLAIRAPEACLKEVPAPDCRVRLAGMERALAGSGYRVISWDVLRKGEKESRQSEYAAARQLGADALILVNDLDLVPLRADAGAVNIRYSRSNPDGDSLGEADLPADTRAALDALVRKHRQVADASTPAMKIILNATVVLADSGEAIWFYRGALTQGAAAPKATSFLLRGRADDPGKPTYRLVSPRRAPPAARPQTIHQPIPPVSTTGESALLGQVTSDLVWRFRTGT